MAPKKKITEISTSHGFRNPSDLTADELRTLTVTNHAEIATTLLRHASWNGGGIRLFSLSLSQDNRSVSSGSFHLAGSLFEDRSYNAGVYWELSSAVTLKLSIEDLSIFNFPDSRMVSDHVSSADLSFSFLEDDQEITADNYDDFGLTPFCIRAYAYPTSDTWSKIVLILNPCSYSSLSDSPVYLDTRFPGFKLGEFLLPLGPDPAFSPIRRTWGFPFTPAVLPSTPFSLATGVPSGRLLREALTGILRSATIPEVKSTRTNYLARCTEIFSEGATALKSRFPSLRWPPLPSSDQAPEPQGWLCSHLSSLVFVALTVSNYPLSIRRRHILFLLYSSWVCILF